MLIEFSTLCLHVAASITADFTFRRAVLEDPSDVEAILQIYKEFNAGFAGVHNRSAARLRSWTKHAIGSCLWVACDKAG